MRNPGFDCTTCEERQRKTRNCHNAKGYTDTILKSHEWHTVSEKRKHVLKFGGLKLFACPISTITPLTWEIIRTVNNTTDADGNCIRPFRSVCWEDEPLWYQAAVEIVRRERAKYRAEETEKVKLQHGRPKPHARN